MEFYSADIDMLMSGEHPVKVQIDRPRDQLLKTLFLCRKNAI
jgi:hypothetical protein